MTLHRRRMRRVVPGVFAALAALSLLASAPAASEPTDDAIAWRDDYGSALAEAKERDQLLWIQFTGPWCPNCARMEQDSFTQPTIREQARTGFVSVKLQSDVNEELAVGFGLSGLPASVIVDPSRQVLEVHQGYLGPEELNGFLRHAITLREPKPANNPTLLASRPKIPDRDSSKPADAAADYGPPRPIKKETNAALSGYCPVSLVADKRLIHGQAEYTVTHQGRLYQFANLVTFNRFRRDPERYVPVNDGLCPVKQLDENKSAAGDPRFGVLFQGRLYLCASKAERQRFLQEPARYAAVGVAEKGFCPHCLVESGEFVRGDPRYSLTQEGRRYWFPDTSHRDAYLALAPSDSTRR
ncbi:MAG: thioredoxin family protein [Paludisphaera borealis]|uniref:thioredoxin family protein n=1 Tax=Paludisphaera borealis TaxID=1387353 RepID=UPI00284B5FDA|nr:thioredoxin family protein [Paludisphaera borealis]MDR3618124.1 thioredoxin family protein [Paludisphaera borealis]